MARRRNLLDEGSKPTSVFVSLLYECGVACVRCATMEAAFEAMNDSSENNMTTAKSIVLPDARPTIIVYPDSKSHIFTFYFSCNPPKTTITVYMIYFLQYFASQEVKTI